MEMDPARKGFRVSSGGFLELCSVEKNFLSKLRVGVVYMNTEDTNVGGKTALIKLGLPKGSLQESTFELFRRAGFAISVSPRSYYPRLDDPEINAILIRAQEISRYVENGAIDAGITGLDWIRESGSDVVEIADLIYAKAGFRPVRWVLAVPEDSPFQRVEDLRGKRIATEVDRKSTRLNSSHIPLSRMPSSA